MTQASPCDETLEQMLLRLSKEAGSRMPVDYKHLMLEKAKREGWWIANYTYK